MHETREAATFTDREILTAAVNDLGYTSARIESDAHGQWRATIPPGELPKLRQRYAIHAVLQAVRKNYGTNVKSITHKDGKVCITVSVRN